MRLTARRPTRTATHCPRAARGDACRPLPPTRCAARHSRARVASAGGPATMKCQMASVVCWAALSAVSLRRGAAYRPPAPIVRSSHHHLCSIARRHGCPPWPELWPPAPAISRSSLAAIPASLAPSIDALDPFSRQRCIHCTGPERGASMVAMGAPAGLSAPILAAFICHPGYGHSCCYVHRRTPRQSHSFRPRRNQRYPRRGCPPHRLWCSQPHARALARPRRCATTASAASPS